VHFTKLQGAGNDFFIIEPNGADRDWADVSSRICDRYFGAGADGVILAQPSTKADLRMRLFNSDGSEAEVSGNGLRCLAKYAIERSLVSSDGRAISIETLAGVSEAQPVIANGRVSSVRVGMGRPRFAPQEIPVALESKPPLLNVALEIEGQTLVVACVSMGNPHAVLFIDAALDSLPIEHIGPVVEHHELFPERVNFNVARVIRRDRIEMHTWERGAGLTLACGSGACATVVAGRLLDLVDDVVQVRQPGGELLLEWDGVGEVFLSGPVEEVYEGEWPD
jgi:diaminopimelate epimerase